MNKLFLLLLIVPYWVSAQFGNYTSHDITHDEATVFTSQGSFKVQSYSPNIIKFTYLPNHKKNKQLSNAVVAMPIPCQFAIDTQNSTLKTNTIDIQYSSNSIHVLHQQSKKKVTFQFFSNQRYSGYQVPLQEAEEMYGGGERAIALNRRGHKFPLYNKANYAYGVGAVELNYSLPIVSSSLGYLLFFDNPQKGYFDIGNSDHELLEYGAIGGEFSVYIIFGNTQLELTQQYMQLVGNQPLPPRWALGNLQSRFGYKTQQEVSTIVNNTIAQNIPIDATIIDLYWFGNGVKDDWQMGDLDWETHRFPNPDQMIKEFSQNGVQTVLITEPFITDQSFNYQEVKDLNLLATDSLGNPYELQEFFFGKGGILDIFKPETQDWIWQKYDAQIKRGIKGWWVDLAEPESHPSDIYHTIGTADEVHNIYGHYWDKMLFERYKTHYPQERLFNLNRSGYAGSARYAVFPWTGDVGRDWSGLQAQLPLFISMSMHGIPYIHSDAGGFAGGSKEDNELYIRWMQLAAFSPIFRPHGSLIHPDSMQGQIQPEPIFWDKQTQDIVKKWLYFRYQHMPYLYQMAYEQQQFGLPLIRPIEKNHKVIENQYLWGNDMLVAPIIQQGSRNQQVFLPKGEWISNNKIIYQGNQSIQVHASIDEVPLFLRKGAMIPRKPKFTSTSSYPNDLILDLYLTSQDTTYTLFEDDGLLNNSIHQNQYELIHVNVNSKTNKQIITITRTGTYPNQPKQRSITLNPYIAIKNKMVALSSMQVTVGINKKQRIKIKHNPVNYE